MKYRLGNKKRVRGKDRTLLHEEREREEERERTGLEEASG